MTTNHARRRAAIAGLGLLLIMSGHASAQDPIYVPTTPQWGVDATTQSMVLSPSSSNLALGLPSAQATLQIQGDNVTASPGTGYLVLGSTDMLHMQLDRNDIRVAGPTDSTVASLYLQRYGGPVVFHSAKPLDERLYLTSEGDLGVATANPLEFAIDRKLVSPNWAHPPGVVAVDGDVWADRVRSREVQVRDRIRVGRPSSSTAPGTAWDAQHTDAILQVAGKISAQSIVVHLNSWADDVFDDEYPLLPLGELADFVKRERHLPDVPAESEALKNGLDVAKTNELLLRKVEELTLYTIAQQEQIDALERKIDALAQ